MSGAAVDKEARATFKLRLAELMRSSKVRGRMADVYAGDSVNSVNMTSGE